MSNAENYEQINRQAAARWSAITKNKKPFVAVIDGDVVDSSNDFNTLAVTASSLKSLRGHGAQMNIFDTESGTPVSQ